MSAPCKALVIAAPASGSGKTLLTLGLLRAFRDSGVRVAAVKLGPDHIDPRFHEAASGRTCFNLDGWAMSPDQISAILREVSREADLLIIEGVMGLFDGPRGARGSTADVAALLGLPVLLTLDCRHQAQSAAALVHGFDSFRPDTRLAGVILNRVASERHEHLLREALPHQVIACLRNDQALNWPSRHLGLVQAQENPALEQFVRDAARRVSHPDLLNRLLDLATAPNLPATTGISRPLLKPLGQSIAIAADDAFSFAYPHVLEGWRKAGAALSFFSPLADQPPDPHADAVFLPGGYPELHAGRLAAASHWLAGLRAHSGLVYGECGGYMVLGEGLTDAEGVTHALAGLLPLATSFASRKLHLGYRRLTPLSDAPWSDELRAHEFHYSSLLAQGEADPLFAAHDAAGAALPAMGLRRGRVMGSYAHVICEAP
ncbi:cobyrinate a,c-diamide synthase [Aestuariivirga sp.]|jgi:cobyrinic acid a,c-diamide synthase|uniref:cobyrinate a,c-diamide synthase n=1 Tax=Aestuariivirga sp. TaxID=2650926 RepID=UPI0037841C22